MRPLRSWIVAAVLSLSAGTSSAQAPPAEPAGGVRSDLVERAVSAAPPSIAVGAAVVDVQEDGKMVTLRKGRNGWTCLPHDPGTPTRAPLCLDANGMLWLQAAMHGKAPDPDLVGYSYMLKGGSVWSATDPAAEKLPEGEKTHVGIPPHMMVLNARLAEKSGFPSGERRPDVRKPFVLYGGTPFAILILPVE
ncbi:MAG TPA: hypothetical protein VFM53_15740 [Anaeromyxobacteraceae bacterium]|nr:hypothetical protein [Anaeromyxobacteraceae bacterium]